MQRLICNSISKHRTFFRKFPTTCFGLYGHRQAFTLVVWKLPCSFGLFLVWFSVVLSVRYYDYHICHSYSNIRFLLSLSSKRWAAVFHIRSASKLRGILAHTQVTNTIRGEGVNASTGCSPFFVTNTLQFFVPSMFLFKGFMILFPTGRTNFFNGTWLQTENQGLITQDTLLDFQVF